MAGIVFTFVAVEFLLSATPLRLKFAEGVNCRFSKLTIVPVATLKSVPGVTEIICACVVMDNNPKSKQGRLNRLFFMFYYFMFVIYYHECTNEYMGLVIFLLSFVIFNFFSNVMRSTLPLGEG